MTEELGTVSRYDDKKGFSFIRPAAGLSDDLFFSR
jgi:cold shock CspA family protein